MEFENARKGIKRIYIAEIFALLASIIGAAAGVIQELLKNGTIPANGTINLDTSSPVMLGIAAAVLVLGLASLILHLTGISKASKDEPKFKRAMLWIVIGIVLSSLSSSLHLEEPVSTGVKMAGDLSSLLVKCFIIGGVMSVAEQMNRPGLKFLGSKAMVWTVLAQLAGLAMQGIYIWSSLTGKDPTGGKLVAYESILLIVSAVMGLIAYIVYLRFLSKASASLSDPV